MNHFPFPFDDFCFSRMDGGVCLRSLVVSSFHFLSVCLLTVHLLLTVYFQKGRNTRPFDLVSHLMTVSFPVSTLLPSDIIELGWRLCVPVPILSFWIVLVSLHIFRLVYAFGLLRTL
jgi:hypothetical protein